MLASAWSRTACPTYRARPTRSALVRIQAPAGVGAHCARRPQVLPWCPSHRRASAGAALPGHRGQWRGGARLCPPPGPRALSLLCPLQCRRSERSSPRPGWASAALAPELHPRLQPWTGRSPPPPCRQRVWVHCEPRGGNSRCPPGQLAEACGPTSGGPGGGSGPGVTLGPSAVSPGAAPTAGHAEGGGRGRWAARSTLRAVGPLEPGASPVL